MAITITPSRHLVEWYRTELTDASVAEMVAALEAAAAAVGVDGPVRLVVTMAVPSDEVLYAVFAASSTDVVIDLCRRAGLPAERVTADVSAHVHPEEPG